MSKRFDVVILGAGNAGMGAAGPLRAAGKTVAMIESWDVGGTCPLRGCVPKKVLVAAAQVLHQIERAPVHHIEVGPARLDWAKLIERERGFVDGVPEAFEESLASRGIEVIKGRARFVARNAVEVNGERIEAGKIVIATGSKPRPLPIPGAEHLITSEEILERTELPDSLIFIGGGVIALEFSHVYARAGTKVTILEALPRLLPRTEADAVAQIHKESERIGIDILTGVKIQEIAPADGGLEVRFEHDGETKSLTAQTVANGTGRVPDLDGLDLAAGEVEHDGLRIAVDETLASVSNPDVYVAGDALTALGETPKTPEYGYIPANVYTVPALASVGLTEAEATEQGLDVTVKANDLGTWRSSATHAESVAFSKVLIENGTGRILGAHIVGHGGEEIIHIFALAMQHGLTAEDLANTVYGYPTFASDIKNML
jgi:glutathione reductase (NADPH)